MEENIKNYKQTIKELIKNKNDLQLNKNGTLYVTAMFPSCLAVAALMIGTPFFNGIFVGLSLATMGVGTYLWERFNNKQFKTQQQIEEYKDLILCEMNTIEENENKENIEVNTKNKERTQVLSEALTLIYQDEESKTKKGKAKVKTK